MNLISNDILKHKFAKKILYQCSTIVNFFNSSHQLHFLIVNKNVFGGGLKTYTKTRWTSAYECIYSVYRHKTSLEEVNIF